MYLCKILKIAVIPTLFVLSLSTPALAKDGALINLPDKKFAVISVGDLESESIGSYSIAVFKDRDLTEFETGAVFSRDGSVFEDNNKPRVTFADINGDGAKELIVYKLTAGSGNYLEVDALKITDRNVKLLARINTDSKHDPIQLLRILCKKGLCTGQQHH
ncbi:PliI family lysozyme inhibitor of I-type lysozyme [Xenorhabdus sp. XENO-7]|uniref:PliI family lysozyme inhibitor of I-type lysozyme n=1 Tax=Xenorhabdus aichiensis TaxID=3025874 RepID=A0ABT5M3F5_9GAMM|nr:PliI family lysozyme inhibitor of I-type lysozyme [Xenorhabdus aichiensis]MDC9621981.1 PliI family lysozyme inhibitor of I-type lysozyme [Xenorhabdus aichiensis]